MSEDVNVAITWKEFKAWKDKHLRRSNKGDDSIIFGTSSRSGTKIVFTFGLYSFDMPNGTTIKELK